MALRARSVEDYLAEKPNEPEWLIDGLLPRGGLTVVLAKPKTGKSILAAQVAGALGLGGMILGRGVFERRRVLYVQLDAPDTDWKKQLRQTRLRGFDTIDFYDLPRFFLDSESRRAELRAYIKAQGYDYVIWDALEKLTKADLNTVPGMQIVMERLQSTFPGPRMLIHHPRKPSGDSVDNLVDAGSGSHYLSGEASAIWLLRKTAKLTGTLQLGGRYLDETWKLEREPETYLWVQARQQAPESEDKYDWKKDHLRHSP